MGLRFRKSIKIAPGVKINLNKKSVSATVGTKGAHYTVNSKGKRTTSVGIPGTGISYTHSTGGGNSNSKKKDNEKVYISESESTLPISKKNKKKHGCLTCIIAIFLLFGFASCISENNKLEKIVLSADTDIVYDINSDIDVEITTTPEDYDLSKEDYKLSGGTININDNNVTFSATRAGSYKLYVEHDDIKSNTITIDIEDKKAIAEAKKLAEEQARIKAEEEARIKAEEEARIAREKAAEQARIAKEKAAEQARIAREKAAEQARINQHRSQQTQQSVSGTVYWVNSGEVYHSTPNCATLKRSRNIHSGTVAQSGKSRPCKICH